MSPKEPLRDTRILHIHLIEFMCSLAFQALEVLTKYCARDYRLALSASGRQRLHTLNINVVRKERCF